MKNKFNYRDVVKIRRDALNYSSGHRIADWVKRKEWVIGGITDEKALLLDLLAYVDLKDLVHVRQVKHNDSYSSMTYSLGIIQKILMSISFKFKGEEHEN